MREFWMKMKCFLSIILNMALVKPKRVGMLMQTAKDTIIAAAINRQAHWHTLIDWHIVKQKQTEHLHLLRTHNHTETDTGAHTHIVLWCILAKSVKYPTQLFGCLLYRKIQLDSDIPQQRVSNEYKQYVSAPQACKFLRGIGLYKSHYYYV